MCVLLHLLICTALRAHIIVVEALYKINYYYYYYYYYLLNVAVAASVADGWSNMANMIAQVDAQICFEFLDYQQTEHSLRKTYSPGSINSRCLFGTRARRSVLLPSPATAAPPDAFNVVLSSLSLLGKSVIVIIIINDDHFLKFIFIWRMVPSQVQGPMCRPEKCTKSVSIHTVDKI